jgi:predicted nucleic acid-binding protein
VISTFTAFFDANVFGARLRSILVTLAQTGLFRARWSEDVHQEWMRAVVERRPDLTLQKLEPTRRAMDRAVPDCLVMSYEPLISGLTLPDPNDRHVLAAAITARASVIVTFNVGDFPADALQPYGIQAKHPDDFILDIESLDSLTVIEAARDDLRHYANPPLTIDAYLDDLRRAGVPKTADHLGRLKVLIESGSGG